MKVLMINSVCGIRSTGRICTDLATILEAKGHEVKIAYGREEVPAQYQKYAVKIGGSLDVKLHGLKARMMDASGLGSIRATKQFLKWVQEYDPDIIHLHNIHGYYINIRLLFEFIATYHKPIIWTLHDCWSFTGHCAYFDHANCRRWETGCYNCPQKNTYPKSFVDGSSGNYKFKQRIFNLPESMFIVTPSNWLTNLVKKSILHKYPVQTIYNGIDLDIFKPNHEDIPYEIPNEKKIVLGVASGWEERKGLRDFVLLSKMLDDEYKIVLVGLTDKQKKALPENILGITRTTNVGELVRIYTRADVFLNLTYEDNYPTTNLEAQACGTPVITYNTGGSPESVLAGGRVIEVGNVEEVCKAIKQITSEPISQNDVTAFSSEYSCMQYLKTYEKILGIKDYNE